MSYQDSTNHPRWSELLHSALTQPGTVSTAFRTFHNYSIGNQLLALGQCMARGITPGPIATFPRWKELKRYVRKGERALTLCQPVTIKRNKASDERSESTTEATEQTECFTRFVYRPHWFVLAQTDGEEYIPDPIPGWNADTALSAGYRPRLR